MSAKEAKEVLITIGEEIFADTKSNNEQRSLKLRQKVEALLEERKLEADTRLLTVTRQCGL